MKKVKRVRHSKRSDSDTQSRTRKVGDGTTTPIKRRDKAFEKKALNKALDEALDKDSAWDLFRKIRDHEAGFRTLIYRFDVGKGYKALGHKSLRECLRERLSSYYSESYLYRQLYAAQIEHNLGDLLPMGKTVSERVLRPLKQGCSMLLDDPHVAQDSVEVEGIVIECFGDVGHAAGT